MAQLALNTIFRIKSHGGGGHYLTVSGNKPLTNNRSLYLTTAIASDMQYWKVIASGSSYKVVSCADESFALNYYWTNGYGNPGQCDIYTHANNSDANITFELERHYDVFAYLFMQADASLADLGVTLYMTPSSWNSGATVSWETNYLGDVVQYWIFEEVSSSTLRTQIDLPSGRIYNWNQFYSGITSTIDSQAGCAWTCGLDVANIYGPNSYSPSSMNSAWITNEGYNWTLPYGCSATFGYYITYSEESEYLEKIRTEINNNRPVVVRMCTNSNTSDTHFVVAYGYTGAGNTTTSIKVFDPANMVGNNYTNNIAGRDTTLYDAIQYSSKHKVSGLRPIITNR